jgi:hypothetical protein
MKKNLLQISIIILAATLSGCSSYFNGKSATEKRVDIIIADTYNKYQNKEIVFERMTMDFPEWQEETIVIAENAGKEISQLQADGSEINTLYDGYGNKTETRNFFNDKLIKFVVVKTTADGRQKAFVYAQNGEVKILPEEFLAKILLLSGDDIARSVEINDGRQENEGLKNLLNPQPAQPAIARLEPEPAKTSQSVQPAAVEEKLISKNVESPINKDKPEIIPDEK